MRTFIKQLGKIVGPANIFEDAPDLLAYAATPVFSQGGDLALPLAVARPRNIAQAAEILELCSREQMALRLRGGGTLPNPGAPLTRHIILLTDGLDRIIEIDAANRLARVQAGARCADLEKSAAREGLFFPPAPVSGQLATIGGCLAANARGLDCLKYGSTADYVDSLEVVTANGARLVCAGHNGQPGKLAPAFPLAQLFCGSLGCLGLIASATLRLLPAPEIRRGLIALFASAPEAARGAAAIVASPLQPAGLELLDAASAAVLDSPHSPGARLALEFDGTATAVGKCLTEAGAILSKNGARGILAQEPERLWHLAPGNLAVALARRDKPFRLLQAACPPAGAPALVEGMEQIGASHGLETAIFGNAALARLWVAFCGGDAPARDSAARDLFTLELVLNNSLFSEAEIGMERDQWQRLHGEVEQISTELRKLFDPAGILAINPLPGAISLG